MVIKLAVKRVIVGGGAAARVPTTGKVLFQNGTDALLFQNGIDTMLYQGGA